MDSNLRIARQMIGVKWFLLVAMVILFVQAASAVVAGDIEIGRLWTSTPPVIDGVLSPGEWNFARLTNIAHGRVFTMNDDHYLYVMLDVVDDTTDRPPAWNGPDTGDYYVLAFDIDQNHMVTPHVDLNYDACNDGRVFIKDYYLSATTFTACQTTSPNSQGAIGFGATFDSATPHRFWEFRLDLAEIGVDPSTWTTASGGLPHVRVNVTTHSESPAFTTSQPDPNPFPDFAGNLYQLDLATGPDFAVGGAGPTFAGVGLVPRSYIDGLGYANINIANYYSATAAPFGGNLNIFGNWNNLYKRGARSYRVLYSKDGGPLTRLRQTWTNFRYNPVTTNWDPVAFGPDTNDQYPAPSPFETWYLTNLLISWQTAGFADGTYVLSLQLFDKNGVRLISPPDNSLTLFVDNTPPTVKIDQVLFDGSPVSACSIENQGPTDGFNFNITTSDVHGALGSYALYGIYGNNLNTGNIAADNYGSHVNADGPEKWNGPGSITVPNPGQCRATTSCAYSFILAAYSRIQNGYGLVFPEVDYHVSLTILVSGLTISAEKNCPTCGPLVPAAPVPQLAGECMMAH